MGSTTPGNRSEMMPSNNGTSWERNLHRFTSMMDRSIRTCSSSSGNLRLRFPAARSTAITARMP